MTRARIAEVKFAKRINDKPEKDFRLLKALGSRLSCGLPPRIGEFVPDRYRCDEPSKQKDRLAAVSPKSDILIRRLLAPFVSRSKPSTRAYERRLETKFCWYEISDLGRGHKISGKASRLCNDSPAFISVVIFLYFAT